MKEKIIGIYKIENLINRKVYIGQSRNIENRFKSHKQRYYKPTNSHLYRSIQKYGLYNFNFSILIEFDEFIEQNILDIYEEYYIQQYKSLSSEFGYNKKHGGAHGLMTEDVKQRISNSLSEHLKKFPIVKDEPHRKALSKSLIEYYKIHNSPFKGRTHSKETKNKISQIQKGKRIGKNNKESRKVVCLETGIIYETITEAKLKTNSTKVSDCCRGLRKTSGGLHWCYMEDYEELKNKEMLKGGHYRRVLCLETKEIFDSIKEAAKNFNIKNPSAICACCKGKNKTAGKDRFNNKLHWKYV